MKSAERKKKYTPVFDLETIRNAVDIVIGDDGFRSNEVVEILRQQAQEDYEQYDGMSGDTDQVTHINLWKEEPSPFKRALRSPLIEEDPFSNDLPDIGDEEE